jgi:hypothetical protein
LRFVCRGRAPHAALVSSIRRHYRLCPQQLVCCVVSPAARKRSVAVAVPVSRCVSVRLVARPRPLHTPEGCRHVIIRARTRARALAHTHTHTHTHTSSRYLGPVSRNTETMCSRGLSFFSVGADWGLFSVGGAILYVRLVAGLFCGRVEIARDSYSLKSKSSPSQCCVKW